MIMVSRLLDPDSESFDFHVLLLYITLNMQIQDWYKGFWGFGVLGFWVLGFRFWAWVWVWVLSFVGLGFWILDLV